MSYEIKPMLASDWDENKLALPAMVQPKIDGVRGVNTTGKLTGRSLKSFKNLAVTELFSHPALEGFDGELALGSITSPSLCRDTSSRLGTINASAEGISWHVFDYVTEMTRDMPYEQRYGRLLKLVPKLPEHLSRVVFVVPYAMCANLEDVELLDSRHLEMGFEGSIVRGLHQPHKAGRSTVKEGGLLRIKRFKDAEAVVVKVLEGHSNLNEMTTNALGLAERSSHEANMVPNAQVGTIVGRLLEDTGPMKAGELVDIGPGRMTQEEKTYYWSNHGALLGKTVKFQWFPKGVKDKLRFVTYQCIRGEEDMG